MKQALLQYDIESKNVYDITSNPSLKQVKQVFEKIEEKVAKGQVKQPTVNYLIISVFVGRGFIKNGRHQMVVNEFDKKTAFYKLLSAESLLRNLAAKYPNAYTIGIFGGTRQIFEFG